MCLGFDLPLPIRYIRFVYQINFTDRQRQQILGLEQQQPIREAFWHRQPIQEMNNHFLPPQVNLA